MWTRWRERLILKQLKGLSPKVWNDLRDSSFVLLGLLVDLITVRFMLALAGRT